MLLLSIIKILKFLRVLSQREYYYTINKKKSTILSSAVTENTQNLHEVGYGTKARKIEKWKQKKGTNGIEFESS